MNSQGPRATRAYTLFVEECETLLQTLKAGPLTGEKGMLNDAEVKVRFHRLKGAAGFFGYDVLGKLAGELEEGAVGEKALDEVVQLLENVVQGEDAS